ncbi:MAG: sigma-70 family RNA polymerase sigma factor [Asticcacaulis sp.]
MRHDQIYKTYRETLISYAGRLMGHRGDAEDIVHEAWLLMNRQPHADRLNQPVAYLRTIIRNLVMSRYRRDQRGPMVAESGEDYAQTISDDTPDPEAVAIARDEMQRVVTRLRQMPQRQQTAIRLYHFENLPLREVAVHLGLSVSRTHDLIVEGMEICDRLRKGEAQSEL